MSNYPPSHPPDNILLHVGKYDFTIPSRYRAGHTLDEGEAKALNQLMTENIRTNITPWVRSAVKLAPSHNLTPDVHLSLQAQIQAYAIAYRFQNKSRARPISAVEAALSELAFSQAEREGLASGFSPDSPEVQLRYRQLFNDPSLKAKAREIVTERERLSDSNIYHILGPSEDF